MAKDSNCVEIDLVKGVAGIGVYINSSRVAGPKPWGGGTYLYQFKARREDVLSALGIEPARAVAREAIKAREGE